MENIPIENLDKGIRMHGASLEVIRQLAMGATGGMNMQTKMVLFAAGCWHAWGRQSFRVAPLLGEALRDTSLDRVPSTALQSPYQALWIEGGLGSTEAEPRDLGLFLISGEVGKDPIFKIGPEETAFPLGTRMFTACALKEAPGLYPYVFMSYVFLCRETLDESIAESLAFCQRMAQARNNVSPDPIDRVQDLSRSLWSFVANFLLYLSSPDPDLQVVVPNGLEKPAKSAKAREIQGRSERGKGSRDWSGTTSPVWCGSRRRARPFRELPPNRRITHSVLTLFGVTGRISPTVQDVSSGK